MRRWTFSPLAMVTLIAEERLLYHIPQDAVTFAFAYPLSGIAEDVIAKNGFALGPDSGDAEVALYLLTFGGFLYSVARYRMSQDATAKKAQG